MKYIVSINIGTRLWTRRSFDFELGRYRWLWRAKLAAWWHVQVWPFREATVISVEPGNDEGMARELAAQDSDNSNDLNG